MESNWNIRVYQALIIYSLVHFNSFSNYYLNIYSIKSTPYCRATCAGKTTLAEKLVEKFDKSVVISQDQFFRVIYINFIYILIQNVFNNYRAMTTPTMNGLTWVLGLDIKIGNLWQVWTGSHLLKPYTKPYPKSLPLSRHWL